MGEKRFYTHYRCILYTLHIHVSHIFYTHYIQYTETYMYLYMRRKMEEIWLKCRSGRNIQRNMRRTYLGRKIGTWEKIIWRERQGREVGGQRGGSRYSYRCILYRGRETGRGGQVDKYTDQGSANYGLMSQIQPATCLTNKTVLENSHIRSFLSCVWLLLCLNCRGD